MVDLDCLGLLHDSDKGIIRLEGCRAVHIGQRLVFGICADLEER